VPSPVSGVERLRVGGRSPALPAGTRIYAIGDIHGRADLLDELLCRINEDIKIRPIGRSLYVFLGDYIDRGARSRETIDRLVEHGQNCEAIFLKGNHEQIAIKCLSDPSLFDQWMRLGGLETLISYGVVRHALGSGRQIVEMQAAFHRALPRSHLRFLRDLQPSFFCGDFFFAHAGVRPDVDLSKQKESDMLWIRDEFLSSRKDFGKIVVHGHTPARDIEVEPNRVNVDTGGFATGRLSCLVIEGKSLSVIDTR
jgi:serine/threonine protein phosphatase 1